MAFEDLYARLETERQAVDLRETGSIPDDPDAIVYRLGFSSVPIAGMPDEFQVGEVKVSRIVGPILTQQTRVRQRHGLPIIFDKSMTLGVEVGHGEVMTVCETYREPEPDLGGAIMGWREEARAALGILAALLDDRVAIEIRFEDMITMSAGKPIGSADARTLLRSFLPFDVTGEERQAISELADIDATKLGPLSEAARWYLKAAEAGPTSDAVVYLWIAIEALTPHRTTSPKTVESMLVASGFNPEWLGDLPMGRLAGVRADIVHKGERDHPLVRAAHYRLETVVRVLIRNAAGVSSSWPPALSPAVFGPASQQITESIEGRETVWHEGKLPSPDTPKPAGLKWDRIQAKLEPEQPPMQVTYSGSMQPGWRKRLDHWVAIAARFLGVRFGPIEVSVDLSSKDFPPEVEMAASQTGLVIAPTLLTLPDPRRQIRLAQLIHEGLAQVAVMRLGIDSVSFGTLLIANAGSWARFKAFYGEGQFFEGEDLDVKTPLPDDLNGLGMCLGASLAGSQSAASALKAAIANDPSLREMTESIEEEWRDVEAFEQLLRRTNELAKALKMS